MDYLAVRGLATCDGAALNEKADVRFSGESEKHCRTTVFDIVDEFTLVEFEQVYGHLAGDELDVGFEAEIT